MSAPQTGVTGGSREEQLRDRINDVVQSPYIPSASRPQRTTNQLQYLLNVVMKSLWKHNLAWPFRHPADAVKLKLPDHHQIICSPIDVHNIHKKLENCYYSSAQECIEDFNTMFSKCYACNNQGEDIVSMAQTLEKMFLAKVSEMPKQEMDVPVPPRCTRKDKCQSRPSMAIVHNGADDPSPGQNVVRPAKSAQYPCASCGRIT